MLKYGKQEIRKSFRSKDFGKTYKLAAKYLETKEYDRLQNVKALYCQINSEACSAGTRLDRIQALQKLVDEILQEDPWLLTGVVPEWIPEPEQVLGFLEAEGLRDAREKHRVWASQAEH